jgi:hypothetical protein
MENNSSDSGVKFDTVVGENQNSITLSKDDFQTILNVLVVVSKRGGFLLEEYKVVGELFDRLKVLSN